MSDENSITNQEARVLAAEAAFYTADLAYAMCAAQFDVASRALSECRTNLAAEQKKLREQP